MGKNFGSQSHSDTVCSLRKQQRKFHRKRYRFVLTAVITQLPVSGLAVKGHFECKFAQPRLDIPGRRSVVAGAHIPPVALCLNQKVLLAKMYQCVTDACIAM